MAGCRHHVTSLLPRSSSSGPGARRVGEYLNSGELRLQDYGLLQDLLSRARLPQVRLQACEGGKAGAPLLVLT